MEKISYPQFFKILKKIFLFLAIFFVVVCLSFYLYIENGAKFYFPEKQRTEIVKQIKSAPQLPENFINFYKCVYPTALQNTFWKRIYRNFTSLFPIRNDELPSQNVSNICAASFFNDKKLNNVFLIRYIEQNTTQKECLNFEFQKFNFRHNRIGLESVSQSLFKKQVKDLKPIELAEIIALSENPVKNDRYRNPEKAQQRTNVFLKRYQINSEVIKE